MCSRPHTFVLNTCWIELTVTLMDDKLLNFRRTNVKDSKILASYRDPLITLIRREHCVVRFFRLCVINCSAQDVLSNAFLQFTINKVIKEEKEVVKNNFW